jgi:hypothetical protein
LIDLYLGFYLGLNALRALEEMPSVRRVLHHRTAHEMPLWTVTRDVVMLWSPLVWLVIRFEFKPLSIKDRLIVHL